MLLSVRLDVEEAAVCLGLARRRADLSTQPGTGHTGPAARRERIEACARRHGCCPGSSAAGRLRGEEDVEVVRLAPTPTAILVPTERGRLAIAAADEKLLLDALSRAARARQRLEDLTREAPPVDRAARAPVEVEVTRP